MSRIRVLSVFGTRPEVIKMAPVIRAFEARSDAFETFNCSTGQHREMLKQMTALFGIRSDIELDVMRPNQSLPGLTARLLEQLDNVMDRVVPHWVVAQGDTTTVLAASMAAFYRKIPFAHVEAGLRTGRLDQPFPEEFNRLTADSVSTLMFAPTDRSRENLLREGKRQDSVFVTGNTVVDSLLQVAAMPYDSSQGPLLEIDRTRRIVLITAHRRESFGEAFQGLCQGIAMLASRFSDIQFVYPVHMNPNVQEPVRKFLSDHGNVRLLPPLDYQSLVHLLKHSSLVLTDSGGIQEEAPGLQVPVLVMRDTTERPEGVEAGVVRLVGTQTAQIVEVATELLTDESARQSMMRTSNPYGDGHAAERIVGIIGARAGLYSN